MAAIEIPQRLQELLQGSEYASAVGDLVERTSEILADNKLAFFPDYTDHGVEHISAVLNSEVDLIPKDVWGDASDDSSSCLLSAADAAIVVGATLLHDIAMHLKKKGFRELIEKESRFEPLDWFKDDQTGHTADLPWHELWDRYQREARRFSDRDLGKIIGEEAARRWQFDGLPADDEPWDDNHYLVVGEFLRRHHARLAHEIAHFGFPGLEVGNGVGQFPALATQDGNPANDHRLRPLADLIGLTARSHGTSLRLCQDYVSSHLIYAGSLQPMGSAVLYPMVLLRVADYLQIDRQRAPAVLLQLRDPQSPVSIREWAKHQAVLKIGQDMANPSGVRVTVD